LLPPQYGGKPPRETSPFRGRALQRRPAGKLPKNFARKKTFPARFCLILSILAPRAALPSPGFPRSTAGPFRAAPQVSPAPVPRPPFPAQYRQPGNFRATAAPHGAAPRNAPAPVPPLAGPPRRENNRKPCPAKGFSVFFLSYFVGPFFPRRPPRPRISPFRGKALPPRAARLPISLTAPHGAAPRSSPFPKQRLAGPPRSFPPDRGRALRRRPAGFPLAGAAPCGAAPGAPRTAYSRLCPGLSFSPPAFPGFSGLPSFNSSPGS
jgi:hypothetical protein